MLYIILVKYYLSASSKYMTAKLQEGLCGFRIDLQSSFLATSNGLSCGSVGGKLSDISDAVAMGCLYGETRVQIPHKNKQQSCCACSTLLI